MELNQPDDQSQALLQEESSLDKPKKKSWWRRMPRRKKHSRPKRSTYPAVTINNREQNQKEDFPTNRVTSTKYTLWNFVPKLLLLEFKKITTIYYTLVCIINLVPALSPISPFTSIIGLMVILGISALREAYEDYKRYKDDEIENNMWCCIVSYPDEHIPCRSQQVCVGDLLFIQANEKVSADVVLLSSSYSHGGAYIETSQLDGETSLKMKESIAVTSGMNSFEVSKLTGRVECEIPHHHIFDFRGTLHYKIEGERGTGEGEEGGMGEEDSLLLNSSSFIPRGSFLRNTDWAVGLVVYVGTDTKSQMNQQQPAAKTSQLEKNLYRAVLLIFIVKLLICFTLATLAVFWEHQNDDFVDIFLNGDEDAWSVITFFSYFVLLSYFIPLPLVIAVQLIRLTQSQFIEWDEAMMTEPGRGAVVRASNLTDELGTIKFLFCDKTGTLTENQMLFAKCLVGKKIYNLPNEGQLVREFQNPSSSPSSSSPYPPPSLEQLHHFLLNMALNHSVITTTNPASEEIEYHASSPDEACLCGAAHTNDYQFLGREAGVGRVLVRGHEETVEYLHSLDFTSERRRMSVLVKDNSGKYLLYTKGADSVILPLLKGGGGEELKNAVRDFSKEGLRTLVLCYREVGEEEVKQFLENCEKVRNNAYLESAVLGGDDGWGDLYGGMERDMVCLGCTAVEDRLQEDVPRSLGYLREAGLKIWVVTGDKSETAINIGYLSNLLTSDMQIFHLYDDNGGVKAVEDGLLSALQRVRDYPGKKYATVIDGKALNFALKHYRKEFLELGIGCYSVLITRATPIQKAKAVELVMVETKSVCMAVGDGANDVSMIREANVGVGVYGKEGTSAVRSADFAIRRFHHLTHLMCVQGRYCVVRNSGVIHYYFYDNAAVFISQIWFAFACGFSAQSLYDDLLMLIFNLAITALPPLGYGIFERDVSEESIRRYPKLYGRTQRGEVWNRNSMLKWCGLAVWHSIVIFGVAYGVFQEGVYGDGEDGVGGLKLFGNLVFTGGIFVVVFQLAAIIQYWNACVHVLVWGALVIYMSIFAIESAWGSLFPSQYWQFMELFSRRVTYFYLALVVFVCVGTEVAFRYWSEQYSPKDYQLVKEREKMEKGEGGERRETVALNDYQPFVGDEGGAVGGWGDDGEVGEAGRGRGSKRASVFSMSTYSFKPEVVGGGEEGGLEIEEEEVRRQEMNLGRRSMYPGVGGGVKGGYVEMQDLL